MTCENAREPTSHEIAALRTRLTNLQRRVSQLEQMLSRLDTIQAKTALELMNLAIADAQYMLDVMPGRLLH